MTTSTTLVEHLVNTIKGVPEFTHNDNTWVSLTMGGQEFDPTNRKVKKPACWVVYTGDSIVSSNPLNPCTSVVSMNFVVKVLVDYDTEDNLSSITIPLLHKIAATVQGSSPDALTSHKFMYAGQQLESLDSDRMVWQQSYTVQTTI